MSELPFDMGPTRLCDVLRGSRSKLIRQQELDRNSMYGLLGHCKRDYVRAVMDTLIEHRLINVREHDIYGTGEILSLSRYGQKYLDGEVSVDLGPAPAQEKTPSRPISNPSRTKDPAKEAESTPEPDGVPLTAYQERMERIRAKYPRAYLPWEEEEEAQLRTMIADGLAVSEIAAELQRQPSAVSSRIRKLDQSDAQLSQPPEPRAALKPRPIDPRAQTDQIPSTRKSRIRNRSEFDR